MAVQQESGPGQYEFRVTLSGAELSQEVVERIDAAVHQAVLREIAHVDIAPSFGVQLVRPDRIKDGSTQGIAVRLEQAVR
jgi:hypothetical protein